jgi:hypothetical protein
MMVVVHFVPRWLLSGQIPTGEKGREVGLGRALDISDRAISQRATFNGDVRKPTAHGHPECPDRTTIQSLNLHRHLQRPIAGDGFPRGPQNAIRLERASKQFEEFTLMVRLRDETGAGSRVEAGELHGTPPVSGAL